MTTQNYDEIIETAYATYGGQLLRRLTAATRDPSAAEDLTQEAFMRLLIEVRAGRAPENTGGWLYRVGQNLAMSRGRRMSVAGRRKAELASPGVAQSPESLVVQAEAHSSLRGALEGLGDTDRRALILSANGFRGPEIAKFLGRTDGATRTLLCRARTKIRGLMLEAGTS